MNLIGTRLLTQEATSHMNLGAMLHVNGKLIEAEQSYLEALRLKPDDHITRTNLQKLRHLLHKKGISSSRRWNVAIFGAVRIQREATKKRRTKFVTSFRTPRVHHFGPVIIARNTIRGGKIHFLSCSVPTLRHLLCNWIRAGGFLVRRASGGREGPTLGGHRPDRSLTEIYVLEFIR